MHSSGRMLRAVGPRRPPGWIQIVLVLSAIVYGASLLFLAHTWPADLTRQRSHHLSLRSQSNERRLMDPTPVSATQRVWGPHEFECLRWVATDDDDNDGETAKAIKPAGETRECWQRIRGGDAGFCEIRNRTSGQIVHAMHTTRLSLKEEVRFTCNFAQRFSDFRHLAKSYRHDPPMALSVFSGDSVDKGIVMAVHASVLASAFASIRQLRDVGCSLPIELWTRQDELSSDHPIVRHLQTHYGPVRLRIVHDQRVRGFYVKAHAVYYTSFAKVLLLDADNFALRDPTPLFTSAAFRRYGAVFWPDFWHPGNTIFNVHAQSVLWELLDLDAVNMLEQESGQVLIDRARSREPLERLLFFATHRPNIFTKLLLVWGDKDLFRLAWLHVGKPFFFNDQRLPGSVGVVHHTRQRFCGMSMVQYDLDGERLLFVHRNTIKLTGGDSDESPGNEAPPRLIWQTVQQYTRSGVSPPPTIQSFNGAKLFNQNSCFGIKRFGNPEQSGRVEMRNASDFPELVGLEDKLIWYARQTWRLVQTDTRRAEEVDRAESFD